MTLRVLIVDDEPLARQRLRQLAAQAGDIVVVGECESGAEALDAVGTSQPDVVLLDVQMPGMDGFAFLEALDTDTRPLVIFTTAHDAHAVRAFESRALDYLLKPFRLERFVEALTRAREHIAHVRTGAAAHELFDLLAQHRGDHPAGPVSPGPALAVLTRLTIRTDAKVVVVRVAAIEAIEAAGNYVSVHTAAGSHILRDTLTALESRLGASTFLRISRSAIVNLNHVVELCPLAKDENGVVLRSGRRLMMTRGLREVEHALRYRAT